MRDVIRQETPAGVMDTSGLAPQFHQFFANKERIKVKTAHDEVLHGVVGMTTGTRPTYVLLRNSIQRGSTDVLGFDDVIIGRRYVRAYRIFDEPITKDNYLQPRGEIIQLDSRGYARM